MTSTVLELRQYTVHPERRDELIRLFEETFLEAHEALGVAIPGHFRDLDRPDRFVFLRGFDGMPARKQALETFYESRVWLENRDAANATMTAWDDVLLLRPAGGSLAFAGPRPAASTARGARALVVATLLFLHASAEAEFPAFFEKRVRPVLDAQGAPPAALLVTEHAPNDYPRLPVREGERAFVSLTLFESEEAHARHRAALEASPAWRALAPELEARLARPAQVVRLGPTSRSLLGNVPLAPAPSGSLHDFDFLEGTWDVVNRRLATRGAGASDWDEFPGVSVCRRHLGGVTNVDEIVFPTKGWAGMTLRAFDVERSEWSIWWISSARGRLEPPVTGGFRGERGEFHGVDRDGERPVRVRFVWVRKGPDAARWEQAFSYDGGPWETNWTMDFRRR